MKNGHVRIWFPICNDLEKVKRTVNSIKEQTYALEQIEIIAVIFDDISEELYCWLLECSLPHFAVYRKNGIERELHLYKEINELSDGSLRMHDRYSLELQAGDVLFPDMIEKCVAILEKDIKVAGVICEADIYQENDGIIHQKPLFEKDKLLNRECRLDRLTFGYFHRVFYFSRYAKNSDDQNFHNWLSYDAHFWTFKFFKGADNTIAYLHKATGVIDSSVVKWDCSLKKMISAYAAVLQFIRLYEYSVEDRISANEQECIWKNYAYMSLAMVCQLVVQERYKEAEDCLLYSKVIWFSIDKSEFYNNVKQYLKNKDSIICGKILRIIIESGGKDFE